MNRKEINQSIKDSKKKDDKSSGKGKEVNLCHSLREEVKIPDAIRSDIFLKHPGDADDDEGEEEGEVNVRLSVTDNMPA